MEESLNAKLNKMLNGYVVPLANDRNTIINFLNYLQFAIMHSNIPLQRPLNISFILNNLNDYIHFKLLRGVKLMPTNDAGLVLVFIVADPTAVHLPLDNPQGMYSFMYNIVQPYSSDWCITKYEKVGNESFVQVV